jgi:hypothetical protein
MSNLYIVGTSRIWKYTIVICEILGNHDKFDIYIHTLCPNQFCSNTKNFRDIIALQNIVGVINGTYVLLFEKKIRIFLHHNLKELLFDGSFKLSSLYKEQRSWEILT